MLVFDPSAPFPLLEPEACTYAEAQEHAEKVDAWLGLETAKVEALIRSDLANQRRTHLADEQLWVGLSVRAMLTPYTEIRQILKLLDPQPGQLIVDLGAGYGRMGFVIGQHYPQVRFLGYEFVRERVDESNRCLRRHDFPLVELVQADLSHPDSRPAHADFYFIYDYGSRAAIEKTLNDLKAVALDRPIQVVARGRASRDAIERGHPWLSQVVSPRHYSHYSLYSSHE